MFRKSEESKYGEVLQFNNYENSGRNYLWIGWCHDMCSTWSTLAFEFFMKIKTITRSKITIPEKIKEADTFNKASF